jgi:hypothetical protein
MDKPTRTVRRQQVHFAQAQPRSAISICPIEDRPAVCRSASNDPGTR